MGTVGLAALISSVALSSSGVYAAPVNDTTYINKPGLTIEQQKVELQECKSHALMETLPGYLSDFGFGYKSQGTYQKELIRCLKDKGFTIKKP